MTVSRQRRQGNRFADDISFGGMLRPLQPYAAFLSHRRIIRVLLKRRKRRLVRYGHGRKDTGRRQHLMT